MSFQKKPEMDLADRLARAMSSAVDRKKFTLDAEADGPAPRAAKPKDPAKPAPTPAAKTPDNVVRMRNEPAPAAAAEDQSRWPLPGLAPMTRVRTDFGDVHSIALRQGDKVLTRSGEYRPILWIKRIRLDAHVLNTKFDSNPVVIGAGALGNEGDIAVSPRQVVTADETSGLREPREAAQLLSHAGVRRLRETGLTYTIFHVGRPAEVYCEGLFLEFPMEA